MSLAVESNNSIAMCRSSTPREYQIKVGVWTMEANAKEKKRTLRDLRLSLRLLIPSVVRVPATLTITFFDYQRIRK